MYYVFHFVVLFTNVLVQDVNNNPTSINLGPQCILLSFIIKCLEVIISIFDYMSNKARSWFDHFV